MILNKLNWYISRLKAMHAAEIPYRIWKKVYSKLSKSKYIKKQIYINNEKFFQQSCHDVLPHINKSFYFDYMDKNYIEQYKKIFPDGTSDTLKTADEISDGRLDVLGLGKIDFGKDINWHSGILTQNSWPMEYSPEIDFRQRDKIGDVRLTWEVNRHHHFVILAKAYFLSQDEKYLDCLICCFNHWIKENPILVGVNWVSAMEAAIRINSWIWCYSFIDKSEGDKAEKLKRDLLKRINQHCLFIEKNLSLFSSANNHLIVETATLCIAGMLFEELPYVRRWLKKGLKILKKELKRQIHPDGVNAEQAFHYQAFVMEMLFLLVILAKKNNTDLPEIISASLKNMCVFFAHLIDKNGNIPEVGDSDDGQVINLTGQRFNHYEMLITLGAVVFNDSYLKARSRCFNEQIYWLWGDASGDGSCLPIDWQARTVPTCIFRDGGYGIIKHKDEEKERIMLFNFAPLGLGSLAAHGHADALSINLSIDGQPVFIDPGTYIYNVQREWRDYFRHTANHNTICIDNKDQSAIGGPFLWTRKAKSKLLEYIEDDRNVFISAQHDGYKPLIHKRSISFIKPDLWIISDELSGKDSYQFELTYNIASGIRIEKIGDGQIKLFLQKGKTLHMQFESNGDFLLNVCPNWVSSQFGKKEEGQAIKLTGRGGRNTSVTGTFKASGDGSCLPPEKQARTVPTCSADKRIKFLGTFIDVLNMKQSLDRIEQIIRGRIPVQHVVLNAAKIVMLNSDRKLRDIINLCGMINADGQSVVWAAKLLGKVLPERVAGIDLMDNIIKMAHDEGFSIYFFGAKQKVVETVVNKFLHEYPGLKVAGYRNGYFTDKDNDKIVDDIRNSNADILFLAFNSPKKEYWLAENLDKLNVPFCMGVGGSFDVAAGLTKRAPAWMQKAGMEWFYRLIQEPKRMWRRYIIGNLKFVWLVIKEVWR